MDSEQHWSGIDNAPFSLKITLIIASAALCPSGRQPVWTLTQAARLLRRALPQFADDPAAQMQAAHGKENPLSFHKDLQPEADFSIFATEESNASPARIVGPSGLKLLRLDP